MMFEVLKDGPLSYDALFKAIRDETGIGYQAFDIELILAMKRGTIIKVHRGDGFWYGLPAPVPEDKPMPVELRKVMGERKKIERPPNAKFQVCPVCTIKKPAQDFELQRSGTLRPTCKRCLYRRSSKYKMRKALGITREMGNA